MRCIIFQSKIVHLPLTRFFFIKIINIIFKLLLALGLYSCAKFLKKSLEQIQSSVDISVLGRTLCSFTQIKFFLKNHCHFHLAALIVQNFKIIVRVDQELQRQIILYT